MKSITLHGLDTESYTLIRQKADKQGKSLNKTIKGMLRNSLGLSAQETKKADFSDLCGVWKKNDLKAFEKATQDLKKIEYDIWK